MANQAHAVQACLNALAGYLSGQVSGLTVYTEWPSANQALKYPSVTLFSGQVKKMNLMPSQLSLTAGANGLWVETRIVGEFDFKMQLDLWTANKLQRDTVMGQLDAALNPDLATADGSTGGLSLQLVDYYRDWARFDPDGFMYVDDEAAAERQERRVKIDLLVNCRAITQRTLYTMTSIEVDSGVGVNEPATGVIETNIVPS